MQSVGESKEAVNVVKMIIVIGLPVGAAAFGIWLAKNNPGA
jgi:hypothetical protein